MSVTPPHDFQQALDDATAWSRVRSTNRYAAGLIKDFRRRARQTS